MTLKDREILAYIKNAIEQADDKANMKWLIGITLTPNEQPTQIDGEFSEVK